MKLFRILLIMTSTLLAGLVVSAQTSLVNDSPSYNVNRTLLLQLVNDVRLKGCYCGNTWMAPVAPLAWNDSLEAAAVRHSKEMAAFDYFSHTSKITGLSASARIKAAGYNWRACGENISLGAEDEQSAIDGWLKSTRHCQNIMQPLFKEMGVGRAGTYWTQAFGAQ